MHDKIQSIKDTISRANPSSSKTPLLIAVSKTKPPSSLIEAYSPPSNLRHFGENYVQEAVEKAAQLRIVCPEIRWHFIGSLQSNKIKALLDGLGSQLASIQTVDTVSKLEAVVKQIEKSTVIEVPVELFLQVNISGEESKHGFCALSLTDLHAAFTRFHELSPQKCKLVGLMAIGEEGQSTRDFGRLNELRRQLSDDFGPLKLSMGMSDDFEEAVRMGSDCVRIGSAIFGSRQ